MAAVPPLEAALELKAVYKINDYFFKNIPIF